MRIYKKPGRVLKQHIEEGVEEYSLISALKRGIRCKFNQKALSKEFDAYLPRIKSENPRIQALVKLAQAPLPKDFPIDYLWQELDPSFETSRNLKDPYRTLLLQAITIPTDLKKSKEGYTYRGKYIESFDYFYLIDNDMLGLDDTIEMLEKIKEWE